MTNQRHTIKPLHDRKNIPKDNDPIVTKPSSQIAISHDIVSALESPAHAIYTDQEALKNDFSTYDDKISELITSKKYFVAIREKHQLFTLGRHKNVSHHKKISTTKDTSSKTKKNAHSKDKSREKAHRNKMIALLFFLWVGFYLLLDSGIISIGVKMPISFFGNNEPAPVVSDEEFEFEYITE